MNQQTRTAINWTALGVIVTAIAFVTGIFFHYDSKPTPPAPPKTSNLQVTWTFTPDALEYRPFILTTWPTSILNVTLHNSGNAPATDISVEMQLPDRTNWWDAINGAPEIYFSTYDGKDQKLTSEKTFIKGRQQRLAVKLPKLQPGASKTFTTFIVHHHGDRPQKPKIDGANDDGPFKIIPDARTE